MKKAESFNMPNLSLPTVDLSVFFRDGSDEEKNKAKEIISNACSEFGFFQAVNHGIPLELATRAMELAKTFFSLPEEEKCKYRPKSDMLAPAGYGKMSANCIDQNEYLLMLPPHSSFNVLPNHPPEFRMKSEVLKDEEWTPIVSVEGTIVVNVGNVIQVEDSLAQFKRLDDGLLAAGATGWGTNGVMTNNKFKSAPQRVLKPKGRSRHSISYFYNLKGDKNVEPLPHFTTQIGEPPKYRAFLFKDYLSLRIRNRTHPPSRAEDVIDITHYSISL